MSKFKTGDIVVVLVDNVPGIFYNCKGVVGKIVEVEREINKNSFGYCVSDGYGFRFWFEESELRKATYKEVVRKLKSMIK